MRISSKVKEIVDIQLNKQPFINSWLVQNRQQLNLPVLTKKKQQNL
jgi:hypothetical protein